MSAIATRTFTQVFNVVRGILRDQTSDRYTDPFLIDMANAVYIDLEERFAAVDIPFGEALDSTNFSYTANALTITIPGGVTDFYEPIEIWQRIDTTQEWQWVNKVDRIPAPPVQPLESLDCYDWSDGKINVNPSANSMLIYVRYARQLAYAAAGDPVKVEGFFGPLVRGVARDAAWATKRMAEGDRQDVKYKESVELAILRAKRRRQGVPTRWGMHRGVANARPIVLLK